MKYAICNETFQNWGWAETCDAIAREGYDGVEIAPFTLAEDISTLSAHARKVYAQTATRAGLKVTGLHWLLVSPKGMSLTTPDESIRLQTTKYLESLVDFCSDMGGEIMVLGSPGQRRIPPGEELKTVEARFLNSLAPAIKRAEMHKITLCLEPLPAPEADFVLTLAQATELATRANSPNVKSIFDIKSALSENVPLPTLIDNYAPMIAHVHVNDSNRKGPGWGDTNFVPIMAALKKIDYQGFVSVEVFEYDLDPVLIAKSCLGYLKRCEMGGHRDYSID